MTMTPRAANLDGAQAAAAPTPASGVPVRRDAVIRAVPAVRILSAAWAIAAKDLKIEVRGRYALVSVLPFAATMLLAFGFSLGPGRTLLVQTAPGLLWLAALFASVELFHRSYQAEADGGALEGLLLAPVDKGAVYLGKAVAAAVQLLVLFVATFALVIVLFGLPIGPRPVLLALTIILGTIGLSALGSLLGLLAVAAKSRQAALPLLVLPLVSPVLIAAIQSTALLSSGSTNQVGGWLGLLAAFDAAFVATGFLVFAHLLED
ncbi:MAG TPA: heme exporter protein CcmB [Pseudonocardiaceae bacterium]|nr:heme exporter protein CcmB [Pseudonocardiaceae bacterium]